MKVRDLIKSSYRLLNIIAAEDELSAVQANEGLSMLNNMLDDWSNQHNAVYQVSEYGPLLLTANKLVYSVGVGASDFDVPRPITIESAFVRDVQSLCGPGSSSTDYTLHLITNQQYQDISLKTLNTTYPYYLMYTSAFPVGTFTIYPAPASNLHFYFTAWFQFSSFNTLDDVVSLPQGYVPTIQYHLALELGPAYGRPVPTGHPVYRRAMQLMANLKRVNAKELNIASYDTGLMESTTTTRPFNIYVG